MRDLAEAFRYHREGIVTQWIEYALSSYSSSAFFKKEQDPFANPVGGVTRQAFETLFPLLLLNEEKRSFVAPLEKFMQLRAVQNFSASQAVAPLYAVKHITRDIFAADRECLHLLQELYDFEFAVDMAVLVAFDLYVQYRERLYMVRIDEIKSCRQILTENGCPSQALLHHKQASACTPDRH